MVGESLVAFAKRVLVQTVYGIKIMCENPGGAWTPCLLCRRLLYVYQVSLRRPTRSR